MQWHSTLSTASFLTKAITPEPSMMPISAEQQTFDRRITQHFNQPCWAILETVGDEHRAAERERYWKNHFESLGVRLLNRREIVCGFVARSRPLKQLAYLKEQVQLALRLKITKCMIWPHSMRGFGYGQVPIGNGEAGAAHVEAWKEAHPGEEILPGDEIMHDDHCIRRCFNPNHLTKGTHQENVDSATRLGRMKGPGEKTAGERNGRAKLTAEQVAEVRQLYAGGMSQRKIARKMGVVRGTIQFIVQGKHWTGGQS